PGFQSLEKLIFNVHNEGQFVNPETILKWLNFLDKNFASLKLISLNIHEARHQLIYYNNGFNMNPNSLMNFVDYDDQLSVYNGKARIELYHCFEIKMGNNPPKQAVEDYYREIKKKFQGSEYSSEIEEDKNYLNCKRSKTVKENFTISREIQLYAWYRIYI
ncbi:hypothetical protein FO519_010663, partial [Halicephalobus sp. NKZ332]